LGNSRVGQIVTRPEPVLAGAASALVGKHLALGLNHQCARANDGLRCWGSDSVGQLGDGTVMTSATPVLVGDYDGVVASYGSSCALHQGAVFCWGENSSAQVGVAVAQTPPSCNNGMTPCSKTPIATGLTGVVELASSANTFHVCARKSDGAVFCWGSNQFFVLGNDSPTETCGTVACSATPLQLLAERIGYFTGATQLAAGRAHNCVLADGQVWCWGYQGTKAGDGGALGNPSAMYNTPAPVQVLASDGTPLKNVQQVVAGNNHSCALVADGSVWCWGQNEKGQLGNGTTTPSLAPVRVEGLCQ
jgi:alpha-tubulin suppressor-like RCC1 family protein